MSSKFSEMLQGWPVKGGKRAARTARLDELRKPRSITQARVAEHLGTNQGEVSRIERRPDIYIRTLAQYIQALGDELEIRAVFPDSEVRITQFEGK
jgi:transcriptional regulator with XRE-family HTH domain